jgi:hypothetical protein
VRIRLHRCGKDGNVECSCKRLIKETEAQALVSAGLAHYLTFKKKSGEIVTSDRDIALIPGRRGFPLHGSGRERERIEDYGLLARYAGLGAWRRDVRPEHPVLTVEKQ